MTAITETRTNTRTTLRPPRVLVALEPCAYGEAIAGAIQTSRPHLEVITAGPRALGTKVARLKPDVVLYSQPYNFTTSIVRPTRIEFSAKDVSEAKICVAGECSEVKKVELVDLLLVIDRSTEVPSHGLS